MYTLNQNARPTLSYWAWALENFFVGPHRMNIPLKFDVTIEIGLGDWLAKISRTQIAQMGRKCCFLLNEADDRSLSSINCSERNKRPHVSYFPFVSGSKGVCWSRETWPRSTSTWNHHSGTGTQTLNRRSPGRQIERFKYSQTFHP